eukprot:1729785-Pyramimonas_sp.AAC.1
MSMLICHALRTASGLKQFAHQGGLATESATISPLEVSLAMSSGTSISPNGAHAPPPPKGGSPAQAMLQ